MQKNNILLFLFFLILFSSCKIEKRLYSKGYHVQFLKPINKSLKSINKNKPLNIIVKRNIERLNIKKIRVLAPLQIKSELNLNFIEIGQDENLIEAKNDIQNKIYKPEKTAKNKKDKDYLNFISLFGVLLSVLGPIIGVFFLNPLLGGILFFSSLIIGSFLTFWSLREFHLLNKTKKPSKIQNFAFAIASIVTMAIGLLYVVSGTFFVIITGVDLFLIALIFSACILLIAPNLFYIFNLRNIINKKATSN